MDQYSETLALEYKAGCDDASGLSTVPGCCAADDPQRESFVRDLVPAEVSTYNVEGAETEKDKDDHGNSIASPGSCVNRLAEVELSGGSVKAFHDLEEALWLVQEELAEEQRLRAEERKHYAVFQDEYLRLQEESYINSERITVAELQCLTALVEDVMPRFKTKLSQLIEQGNAVVALLASRWPEAKLRKQIEALGMEDQPLARWALFHALKTKEIPLTRVAAQRTSDSCISCPVSSGELGRAENILGSTISKYQGKAGEAVPFFRCVEETPETTQPIRRTTGQADIAYGKGGRGRLSKLRMGAVNDATFSMPIHFRHKTEGLPSRVGSHNNASFDRQAEGASIPKDGSKLVSRSSSVAASSRLQTASDRKIQPDSTVQSTPSGARHPLPPLPVGKIALQRPAGPASRDSYRTQRIQPAFTRNTALSEASPSKKESSTVVPPVTSRRNSSRQTRQCKEGHGMKASDSQDPMLKPASFSSHPRRSASQRRISSDNAGILVHINTLGNLRATQPPSVLEYLPRSGLPSRMTCGTVLPTCKDFIRKQSAACSVTETKEQKRGTRPSQDLAPLVPEKISIASQGKGSAGMPSRLQSQKTASLPSLSSLHEHALVQGENIACTSDKFSGIVSPLTTIDGNEDPTGLSSTASNPQLTHAPAPVHRHPLRSSRTGSLPITSQGQLGGKPKDHTEQAEAVVVTEDHSSEVGQKLALHSLDVANRGVPITHLSQEGNGQNSQAPCPFGDQSEAIKGRPDTAASARFNQGLHDECTNRPPLPSPAAPGSQAPSPKLVTQKEGELGRDSCNTQESVSVGVARGMLPVHLNQFQQSASQQQETNWVSGIPFEVPQRSSLPENVLNGLQSCGSNTFVQRQPVIVVNDGHVGLPWPTRTVGQRPVTDPRSPCSYGFHQRASFQQHSFSIPQQPLQSQPQQLQWAVPNQQQAEVQNMHCIIRNVGPDSIARKRQNARIPMPGGWRNR
ncbi:hypothetical protein, conserved [Eimeria maxima]|uniref:Uncharacterized protein n=1 Tax=Eimeria maxima TaxID=5804 RepID=U6M2N6_EIMMA|nr:hypothetical protein, conserved [Eimeria maxima]CDJ58492.1 hypothetical protein, conserved [Eimeria maxima]